MSKSSQSKSQFFPALGIYLPRVVQLGPLKQHFEETDEQHKERAAEYIKGLLVAKGYGDFTVELKVRQDANYGWDYWIGFVKPTQTHGWNDSEDVRKVQKDILNPNRLAKLMLPGETSYLILGLLKQKKAPTTDKPDAPAQPKANSSAAAEQPDISALKAQNELLQEQLNLLKAQLGLEKPVLVRSNASGESPSSLNSEGDTVNIGDLESFPELPKKQEDDDNTVMLKGQSWADCEEKQG